MELQKFIQRDHDRKNNFDFFWNNQLPKAFSHLAAYYDKINSFASFGLSDLWSDNFVNAIHLNKNYRVLDLCCGTHAVGRRLLRYHPEVSVYAVDQSLEMILQGKHLAAKRGLFIEPIVSDAHNLPFANEVFDVVTLQFASRHLEVVKAFKEVHRVLKPGGVFYHSDLFRPKFSLIETLYIAYLRIMIKLAAYRFSCTDSVKGCSNYFIETIKQFYRPDEIITILNNTGFENIRCKTFLTGVLSYQIACKPKII